MADILLEPLPTEWEGRAIDPDFRPMVWLSNQYQRKREKKDTLSFAQEAFQRFYREPIPPQLAPEAYESLLRFYHGADPPGRSGGKGSGSGEIAMDFACDADYLTAAFQQAYHIDLTAEHIHWWRFLALLRGLPEETTMAKIMSWRTMDTSGMEGRQRQQYEDLKETFALPKELRHTRTAVTVADHNAAFLQRLMDRGTNKLLEQLRTGSIEVSLDAALSPGDVAFCTLPELGYKATVRVADVITQSQSDGTTRTLRLGTPVWHRL